MAAPPPPVDDRDRIELRVPADARYARVVRVAISAYGLRLGLAPTAIDDLRLALDEALILLLGSTPGPDGDGSDPELSSIVVTLDLDAAGPTVVLDLRAEPELTVAVPDPAARSRFEEILPTGVQVDASTSTAGRVTLRHPTGLAR